MLSLAASNISVSARLAAADLDLLCRWLKSFDLDKNQRLRPKSVPIKLGSSIVEIITGPSESTHACSWLGDVKSHYSHNKLSVRILGIGECVAETGLAQFFWPSFLI
jgi:hypothetical protein